jgi:hypothetical protein
MTSATDPHRRFLRQQALMAGLCWIVVALAAAWAWRVPALTEPALTAVPDRTGTAPAPPPAIESAIWNVSLWRSFTNEAPVAVQASATAPKLYSILQQGDGLTAAIAPGPNAGLVYLKAGDSSDGFTVVRVEADGVVLLINGQEQRLGLGP